MSKHTINKLGNGTEVINHKIAFSNGKDSDKELIIRVHFDGKGYEKIQYIVTNRGEETPHPDFDLAVEHYNSLP
jgi:hypothetical protein